MERRVGKGPDPGVEDRVSGSHHFSAPRRWHRLKSHFPESSWGFSDLPWVRCHSSPWLGAAAACAHGSPSVSKVNRMWVRQPAFPRVASLVSRFCEGGGVSGVLTTDVKDGVQRESSQLYSRWGWGILSHKPPYPWLDGIRGPPPRKQRLGRLWAVMRIFNT